MGGWIKIHRSMLEWEWYDDANVKILFLHCLLKANRADKKYRGTLVKRGSFLTSLEILSLEAHLSVQQVRTALSKLKSTSEITVQSTSRGTAVTILNYGKYQDREGDGNTPSNAPINNQATNEQQTNNKQVTTNKKDKNIKKDKNTIIAPGGAESEADEKASQKKSNAKQFIPPSLQDFGTYVVEYLTTELSGWDRATARKAAYAEFKTIEMNNWKDGNGKKFPKNWKVKIRNISKHWKPWAYRVENSSISSLSTKDESISPKGWQGAYKAIFEHSPPPNWQHVDLSKKAIIQEHLQKNPNND